MAVLSTCNLSVAKRDRLLFEHVNIAVDPGSLLYVKGPNGAGKTSLLRVLAGLVEADSGEVLFNQESIKSCADQYQKKLIYFGHKLGINHTLSPLENLRFWCDVHQVRATNDKIYAILATLGLVGLEDVAVASLSAGQQRRTALARFWLKDQAKLWILDEPFTALDTQGIGVLSQRLVEYLSQGGTVIMTSHQSLELEYPTTELTLEYRI